MEEEDEYDEEISSQCDLFELSGDEMDDDDDDDDDDVDELTECPPAWSGSEGVNSSNECLIRTTKPVMTKFERVRMLGMRASQISKGAHTMLDPGDKTQSLDIARMEMERNIVPLCLRRKHPNGSYEDWSCSELSNITAKHVINVLMAQDKQETA